MGEAILARNASGGGGVKFAMGTMKGTDSNTVTVTDAFDFTPKIVVFFRVTQNTNYNNAYRNYYYYDTVNSWYDALSSTYRYYGKSPSDAYMQNSSLFEGGFTLVSTGDSSYGKASSNDTFAWYAIG